MKQRDIIFALCFAVAMVGFAVALAKTCTPRPKQPAEQHGWSKWKDDWDKPNDFGWIRQRRYCTNCGIVQVELHR